MPQRLIDYTARLGSAAIAFSGGADSSFVLAAACRALSPEHVLALICVSPLSPSGELDEAKSFAKALGVRLCEVRLDPLSLPEVKENTPLRCYHCKTAIFSALRARAAELGFDVLLDGQNADDVTVYRPGARAAAELNVLSPLKELGYAKSTIRECLRGWGLDVSEKPAAPCLATRIPYGTPITAEALAKIDAAERFLRENGFPVVRVRHHGDLARIEVPSPSGLMTVKGLSGVFHSLGYTFVTVDVDGYRSGCYDGQLTIDGGLR